MALVTVPNSCGSDTSANALSNNLLDGVDFPAVSIDTSGAEYQLPTSTNNPLYNEIEKVSIDNFTSGSLGGDGIFDKLIKVLDLHLQREFTAKRITGREYSEAYIAVVNAALGTASQIMLGSQQSYWNAVTAQLQARTSEVNLVNARVALVTAKQQMALAAVTVEGSKMDYASKKISLSSADVSYCIALLDKAARTFNNDFMLDIQKATAEAQRDSALKDVSIKDYTLSEMMPAQKNMILEQTEVQRSQTMNTRSDNVTAIGGIQGKQMALLTQQTIAYQRDGEVKAAKMFIDTWVTRKTIDEGTPLPASLDTASLETLLGHIKSNNGLS